MILRSSLVVTGLALMGSGLGFLVQMEVAKEFGTSLQVDGYLFAISTPTFFAGMLSSLLSYTVVPRMAQGSDEEKNRFLVTLFFGVAGIAFALILLNPLLQAVQTSFLLKSSPIFQLIELNQLLQLGWWIAAAQILLACLAAALTGLQRPIISTALNLGPYFGMLGLLQFSRGESVLVVAEGMLIGTIFSLLVSFILLRPRIVANLSNVAWSEINTIITRSPYAILAMTCFASYSVVDSYWAPRAGEGVLATLGYSQRIIIALGNLAVIGPSVVMVPQFSELIAKGSSRQFLHTLIKTFFVTGGIALFLAILLFGFAEEFIQFLFMRGAFELKAVNEVAKVLRYYMPGMVFMLLSVVGLRVSFCFGNNERSLAILGVSWALFYFLLSSLFFNLGAIGFAIAYSLVWTGYFLVLIWLIINNYKYNFYKLK
ncbi:hypothetical protein G6681_01695 [Polynucleobacter paneuropaeus]|nr:hypothetical protein G6681_01695 [Polynucleobacter paneuropaeus]